MDMIYTIVNIIIHIVPGTVGCAGATDRRLLEPQIVLSQLIASTEKLKCLRSQTPPVDHQLKFVQFDNATQSALHKTAVLLVIDLSEPPGLVNEQDVAHLTPLISSFHCESRDPRKK